MRRLMVLLAAMAAMVVGYAGTALAATVVNGGFETGDTSGWTVVNEAGGDGNWYVCSSEAAACPAPVPSTFPPPEGTYAAISSQRGEGSHILYQDVTLEAGATHQLSFTTYYENQNIAFYTPDSLSYGTVRNQQYRIDIMKPDAPVDSVAPEDILATVFRTEVGDPSSMEPTPMTVDLSQFAGSTVRLRFAEVDNQFYFVAGVDDVKVTTDSRPGSCTIEGTIEGDVLLGTPRDDVICGKGGGDVIRGRGGDDTVRGGGANDTLRGGGGDDTLRGGAGDDALITKDGVRGNDLADGGSGRDVCASDPQDTTISCI